MLLETRYISVKRGTLIVRTVLSVISFYRVSNTLCYTRGRSVCLCRSDVPHPRMTHGGTLDVSAFELERDAICANSILNCASITCVERQIAGNTVCSGSDRTYSALRVNKVNDWVGNSVMMCRRAFAYLYASCTYHKPLTFDSCGSND